MTEKKRMTIVIEFDEGAELPAISASSKALGGDVVAVQFSDALAELEALETANE
jgi:hypothetical protein